jgi:hypothetical protein
LGLKDKTLVIAILVIVFLIQPLAQMGEVKANPFMFGPYIGITSPHSWHKETYQTSTIPVEVHIETPTDYPKIVKIYYILDLNYSSNYNPQKSLSISNPNSHTYSGVQAISYYGTGTLKIVNNGTHTLDAYAVNAQGKTIKSGTCNFFVNATSISSLDNSEQSLVPAIIIISLGAVAAGIVVAIVIYRRRKISK